MKKTFLKLIKSFAYSSIISLIILLLIEVISTAAGHRLSPLTPEFVSYFPSETMALQVDILLYGVLGAVFSGMSFIYEINSIGFVLQNIIYCLSTAIVWIPIVTFIWQLWKYPQALICTIAGFIITYVIMTIIAYSTTRKDISDVNMLLQGKSDYQSE